MVKELISPDYDNYKIIMIVDLIEYVYMSTSSSSVILDKMGDNKTWINGLTFVISGGY